LGCNPVGVSVYMVGVVCDGDIGIYWLFGRGG
jgi:hypothetical protein